MAQNPNTRQPYKSPLIVRGTADITIHVDHPFLGFAAHLFCIPGFEISTDNYKDDCTAYILKGGSECTCIINGKKIVLSPDKGCICNKGDSFCLKNTSEKEIKILLIRPKY